MSRLPAGHKINPYEVDLVTNYLQPKVDKQMPVANYTKLIHEADFYQNGPDWISATYEAQGMDNLGVRKWYFFTLRKGKGNQSKRDVGNGYWKATGNNKSFNDEIENVSAQKRNLVYHKYKDDKKDRKTAIKTNWMVKEYFIKDKLDDGTLCVMYQSNRTDPISKGILAKRKNNGNPIIKKVVDEQQNAKRLQPSSPTQSSSLPMSIQSNSVMRPSTIGEQSSTLEAQQELLPESKDHSNDTTQWSFDELFLDGNTAMENQQPIDVDDALSDDFWHNILSETNDGPGL